MDDKQDYSVLETHFGSVSLAWRLGSHIDEFELRDVSGLTNVSIELYSEQAASRVGVICVSGRNALGRRSGCDKYLHLLFCTLFRERLVGRQRGPANRQTVRMACDLRLPIVPAVSQPTVSINGVILAEPSSARARPAVRGEPCAARRYGCRRCRQTLFRHARRATGRACWECCGLGRR
jgi:hypothetical protein